MPRTYLLAWNPNKWDWEDLENKISEVNRTGATSQIWSIASYKKAQIDDRVFLMKLGKDNKKSKGIMASGYIKSEPFLAPHWDGSGKLLHRAKIEFDNVLDYKSQQLLSLEKLEEDVCSSFTWTPQNSGIQIKREVAEKLEEKWFDLTMKGPSASILAKSQPSIKGISEGTIKSVYCKRYERSSYARNLCIEHHGCSCAVCGLSFEEYYGNIGSGYIHVHHLESISSKQGEYLIDPINDLIPVCANCHSMLHKRIPAFTVEELKKQIRRIK
ncbi:HNH endonuclease [Sphingobacterium siyangense]|uniref:HNH endonuclease n=1 Tax=Sphingobacterium siyangense TaxID=459529 RepID=UPI003DA3C264